MAEHPNPLALQLALQLQLLSLCCPLCPAAAYPPVDPIHSTPCLVPHAPTSQDPLFLDLIGTCHSDSVKPPILKPRHLTWYRTHLARGLTLYPPHILSTMLKEKKLQQDQNGALMLPIEVPQL